MTTTITMITTMAATVRNKHFLLLMFCLFQGQPGWTEDSTLELNDVQIIILSQSNTFHGMLAHTLMDDLDQQAQTHFSQETSPVILLHEEFSSIDGAWSVSPLLPYLKDLYSDKKWIFFCEDETSVNLKGLLNVLQHYDHNQPMFLGKSLRDQERTIIHHFDDPLELTYPHFAAGFAVSLPLITNFAANYDSTKVDFTIDSKQELAKKIWNGGNGTRLTDVEEFCVGSSATECVTNFPDKIHDCGPPIAEDDVYFAVKTCEKFHKDRLPVVMRTWGAQAKHIEYYSETRDDSIPTIDLGVPNTESGHCGKLHAIMTRFNTDEMLSKFKWLVVADDDSLISVERLRKLLACYNPEENVALGERYAYAAPHNYGYTYITGGGGMVLSRKALTTLLADPHSKCSANDSPDDMLLGIWLKRNNIDITHSPLFHQARPDDYSIDYIRHQESVSFHKHWMNDPYEVYTKWLKGYVVGDPDKSSDDRTDEELHDEL